MLENFHANVLKLTSLLNMETFDNKDFCGLRDVYLTWL